MISFGYNTVLKLLFKPYSRHVKVKERDFMSEYLTNLSLHPLDLLEHNVVFLLHRFDVSSQLGRGTARRLDVLTLLMSALELLHQFVVLLTQNKVKYYISPSVQD